MYHSITAVLDEDILVWTILRSFVCPGAFPAFYGYGIVVDAHITTIHEHIVAYVDVNGVATRRLHTFGGSVDMTVEEAHVVGTIEMVGPERTVLQTYILDGDILAVRYIYQARTLGVFISTLWIPLAADPELLPIMIAVAVDSAMTSDGETIEIVGIDKGSEVFAGLSLYACLKDGEVGDALASLQLSAVLDKQVGLGLEEQGSAEICSLWHHDNTAA